MTQIVIHPTISMQRGDCSAVQCMSCGCIAVVPTERVRSRKNPLGACPVCAATNRRLQMIPVGGIGEGDSALAPLGSDTPSDRWLYLPGSGTWINPAHIAYIIPNGVPGTLDVGYTLNLSTGLTIPISGFDYADDVAVITAWLEARS